METKQERAPAPPGRAGEKQEGCRELHPTGWAAKSVRGVLGCS